MNKNKKFVALICALTMIFSVFAGMTVVNADEITQGIVLEYDASNSTADKAVVVAKSVGFTEVESYTVNINLPEGATLVPTKQLITGGATGTNGYSAATDTAVAVTDGVLVAFEISLAAPLEEAFEVSLQAKSGISMGSTKLSVERANLPITTVSIPKYVDPDATPEPTPVAPIATRAPKPTPVVTETPGEPVETKAPVEVTQGIELEYDASNSTADKAVVVAKSVGFTEVESYTVNINLPEGATLVPTKQLITGGATGTNGYAAATDTAVAVTDGVLVAFEISLAQPLTEPFIVELQAKSGISMGSTKLSVERANLPIAWTTIPVTAAPTEAPIPTEEPKSVAVTLPDLGVNPEDTTQADNKDLYIALVVTKKDGSKAVYGTDYAAELTLSDGTKKTLTAEELTNILNGYTDLVEGAEDLTMADVISNLKFKAYSDGTVFEAQLINDANGQVISGGEKEVTFAPEKTPTLTATASKSSVTVGTKVTITAKVTNPAEEYVILYELTEGAENATALVVADDMLSASFKPAAKGTYEVTVTYIDSNDVVLTDTVTVKATESTIAPGGGSSSGSAGGNIASGGTTTVTGGGKIAFVDLDTVVWAQDAILRLVDLGVINGRSESIFDPEGTVTRAEFAKMVVLAFNLTGGAGATLDYFSDVDLTDWYAPYVVRGYYSGVISGYDDNTFRPNGLITRQEMAAMISRAVKAAGKSVPATVEAASFSDAYLFGDWAVDAISTLQQGGVIDGMGDGTFAPLDNATRAQAAVIIDRAIRYAK